MEELFVSYLTERLPLVEGALAAAAAAPLTDGAARGDLDRYLYGPLERFTASGGKRVRPVLALLGAEAVGERAEDALSCAVAVELFQSAALIHDDIADNGHLRRGKPCLHITEGVGIAINCGDYALTLVTDAILRDEGLDDACKLAVLRELVDMMQRTVEGQALDLGWVRDGRFDITVADYLAMATHKTAYYSGAIPLACGAIIGGGTTEQIEALRSFGMDTGLAFQIQDDLLNLIGEKESRNKDFRSDITEGKRTLVAVHALRSSDHHDELVDILTSETEDPARLARAVELFEDAGSIDYARNYALELTARAKRTLGGVELDARAAELLLAMADFFVERLN